MNLLDLPLILPESARLARPIKRENLRPVHKCKLSVAAGEAIHRNWSKGVLANGIKISK